MNTITGPGKGRIQFLMYATGILLLNSCHQAVITHDEITEAKASVKIAKIAYRNIEQSVNLTATTKYFDKSEIVSPTSGYITALVNQPGDFVKKGQKLFSLETKEHRAMHQDTAMNKSPISEMGQFSIDAPADGFVTDLLHAGGDYILEGSALCSFIHSDKLLFQAYIPFAYNKIVKTGNHCTLILPDSTVIPSIFGHSLNTTDAGSQTILILIIPDNKVFLPEGLNAILRITTGLINNAQVVPETALLSDETLRNFWIMKLINDSTAIKLPVNPGMRQGIWVQIKDPVLNPNDRFITEGNYGLSDTAKVEVEK